jgi:hypothetical protein
MLSKRQNKTVDLMNENIVENETWSTSMQQY